VLILGLEFHDDGRRRVDDGGRRRRRSFGFLSLRSANGRRVSNDEGDQIFTTSKEVWVGEIEALEKEGKGRVSVKAKKNDPSADVERSN